MNDVTVMPMTKNIRDLFGLETRDDLDAAGFEFEIWKLKKKKKLFSRFRCAI